MSDTLDGKTILLELSETPGPSGYEAPIRQKLEPLFQKFTNQVYTDRLGNLIGVIKGQGDEPRPRIMIATHMDEIGLIVSKIEPGGFLRFTQLGGFDPRTLLGQEVIVHGRETCTGIIGSKPPHLSSAAEREKSIPLTELFIDLAMPEADVHRLIQPGDIVTIARKAMHLQNDYVAGKSMDNRASIVVLLECLQELKNKPLNVDVYAVATVQEEVGTRGAITGTYGINPDLGIAVDVAHGSMPGLAPDQAAKMDGGAIIHQGPNIHREILAKLIELAEANEIPYQFRLMQGPTATDGRAIQITREGVPTGVLSVPLRYMHTSVETLCYRDVQRAGKLLAHFVASVDRPFVEGLSCYLKD